MKMVNVFAVYAYQPEQVNQHLIFSYAACRTVLM